MKYFITATLLCLFIFACQQSPADNKETTSNNSYQENTKQQLLLLEHKWLEYEFALDTAPIAKFLDDDFIGISAEDTSNKQNELAGVYKNMSDMRSDSIFIDSFKIEEPFIVKQFDNTAIAIFTCHTYKTAKGKHQEKRTKFYDVWRKVNEEWKAISSQGTVVEEIK